MEALHQDDFQTAVNLLHRANYMLRQHSSSLEVIRLKAITLNNLGCLYKRSNQYSKSLQFLKEALECEKKLPSDYTNIAGTHLNLSAIKSLMSNHEDSLSHALKAINIIQQNPELDQELIRSLVVAYYNAGTEYQLLNRNGEASTFLRHGFNLAYKYLGHDHPLTLSFGLKKSNRSKPKIIDYELINRSLDLSNSNKKFLPDLQNKSRAQTIKNDGIELDTTPWEDQNKGNLRGIFRSDGKNKNNEITTPRKKFGKAINDHKSMSPRVTDNKTSTRAEFTKQMKSETEKSPFKLSPSIDHNQKNLLNKSDTQQSPKNSILTPRKTEPLKLPVKLSPMNEKPQIKSNNKILKEKLIPQKIQKKTVDSPKISYDSPSPTVKTKDSSSNLYNVSTKGSTYSSVAPPKTKEISNSPLQMMSTLDSSSSPMPNSMVKNKSNGPMTPLLDTPVQPRKSVSPLSSEVKTRLTSIDDKLSVLQNRLNIFENKIQPLKELTETEEDDLSSITSPDLQISSKRTQAATKIQSKYRGYKTRQKYLQFLRCVLKIQKNIKG